MQKLINSHKRQKKLNLLVIVSVLILALLTISSGAASSSNLEFSHSSEMVPVSEHISAGTLEETGDSGVFLTSNEDLEPPQKISQYVDIAYTIGGIGAAALIFLAYFRMTSGSPGLTKNPLKTLHLPKIWKTTGQEESEEIALEKYEVKKLRFLTAVPVLSIALAELLIFSGRMGAAVWVHICTLIALSLSNIVIKDPEIHKIHQALMLLPVLRLINLSMPIFFDTTLYTFVFIYGPLAIPLAVIIVHQRNSLEQIGITLKHIIPYMFLSVPLGFLLGLGEYLTIRTDYLIPDLTFINLLKLTIIMVFFVGLIEELIFRSVLQTRLSEALSVREALIITSILFGLMHSGYGTYHEMLYTCLVGFIMGALFYKTKSLPFIAVLHGFVNVFLFGILPHLLSR
ncbi:CAAX amino terminal protease family protein [Methanosarcina lacustris Z-7289]|uniref:CAAX amino terminal protease family protein n=1 Tax=Methanosarcina lacustris Z-7289 TaxID=1434111 RepID=A0A0E3S5A9_9EURY|nr:CPBP family intramembrane glutamic endopeptidase [Methanosarcina lacustris]AKB76284.1 CAAX amino terminal protease family protein [Methanosarcina lacustris Z-7289]